MTLDPDSLEGRFVRGLARVLDALAGALSDALAHEHAQPGPEADPAIAPQLTGFQRRILAALEKGPRSPCELPKECQKDRKLLYHELGELRRRGLIVQDRCRGPYRLP